MLEQFSRLAQENIPVKIVYSDYTELKSSTLYKKRFNNIQFYQLEDDHKHHFIVVDGRHIRLEKPHVDDDDQKVLERKGTVVYNSYFLARIKQKEFDNLLKSPNHTKQYLVRKNV